MFSIKVGAQWTQSTGWPIKASVFQAVKILEVDGGQYNVGNDNISPLGKFERAMEIPAM